MNVFPELERQYDNHEPGDYRLVGGMTLRDWFAGQALIGAYLRYGTMESTAETAYKVADDMLKERAK